MKVLVLAGAGAAALCGVLAAADGNEATRASCWRSSARRWTAGRWGIPTRSLAISDPRFTYFHVVTDKRLDGCRR